MPKVVSIKQAEGSMKAAGKTPGWAATESCVIANPKIGVQVLHVVLADDAGNPLYDQILRCERSGGVSLPVDSQGRIGLIKPWRPTARDQEKYDREFPNFDLNDLGQPSWEIPRGMAKPLESSKDAVRRETEEETGLLVLEVKDLGMVVDNTTFNPHKVRVQQVLLNSSFKTTATPDPNEKIFGKIQFFTREQIRSMQQNGEIYCAFTLAALGMYLL